MKCQNCDFDLPKDKLKCSRCGVIQSGRENIRRDNSRLLRDVKSNDIERLHTGPWDIVWGENWQTKEIGLARGSLNLLAGQRGCGKSTLLLQIANEVATPKEECLYIGIEEPDEQIKSRADRLGIDLSEGRIRMLSLMTGEENDIAGIIANYKPKLVLMDSISAMTENLSMQVSICFAVKKFCSKTMVPAILTSHINKGGDVAGLEALQHAVDSVVTFFPDGESEDSARILHVEKNRNGRAFISFPLTMTVKGLVPLETEE